MDIIDVLKSNRQTGQTTALINLIKNSGGTLIVGNQSIAQELIRAHNLSKWQVVSVTNLSCLRGREPTKIFVDNSAIGYLYYKSKPVVNDGYYDAGIVRPDVVTDPDVIMMNNQTAPKKESTLDAKSFVDSILEKHVIKNG